MSLPSQTTTTSVSLQEIQNTVTTVENDKISATIKVTFIHENKEFMFHLPVTSKTRLQEVRSLLTNGRSNNRVAASDLNRFIMATDEGTCWYRHLDNPTPSADKLTKTTYQRKPLR